jgi:hypothetical protein
MRLLLVLALTVLLASVAAGQRVSAFEGWEGSNTLLGSYGSGEPPVIATIRAGLPVAPYEGAQCLELEDNSPSGTPQAYVAWIKNLSEGDMVTVSLWRYDDTPDASPSCRIWGHWNDDLEDVSGYAGSAGGNDDYGMGTGWEEVSWTWTNPVGSDAHVGLVVEVRTYSNPGDTVWIDAMTVEGPEGVTIITPESGSPVTAETWSAIKALYR